MRKIELIRKRRELHEKLKTHLEGYINRSIDSKVSDTETCVCLMMRDVDKYIEELKG